jgi:transposase
MGEPKYRDREWLHQKYVIGGLTQKEIAETYNIGQTTVSDWLNKHGIEYSHHSYEHKRPSKSWLRTKYHKEGKTQYKIAEKLGVSQSLVSDWFEELGIESRDRHAAQGISSDSPLRDREWLYKKYVEERKSTCEMAELLDVTDYCVGTFLEKHDIEARSVTGEDHPMWNGGKLPYGPGWNKSKRRSVRERDGHRCQDCGIIQTEHQAEYDEKLHVHHLIKARDIDDPEERNAMENLITLCRDCHREWERLSEAGIRPQIGVAADD